MVFKNDNKMVITTTMKGVTALVFASILLLLLLPSPLFVKNIAATQATTSIVSTRGHFGLSSGNLLFGHTETDYRPLHIPRLQVGNCPPEIVIYVHGWAADSSSAVRQFNVIKKSLESPSIGYRQPVIGFS
jgi:hypothetical protein